MHRYILLLIGCCLLALLLGCASRDRPPAGPDYVLTPFMPPLEPVGKDHQAAPVFGSKDEYTGSPLEQVGYENFYAVHGKQSTRIALLRNGDESFAARVQMLEKATMSIRIQALVFWADESGLYIADILKKKKAEGLDVRVIVDAPSNLGLQTQWMYFDLKQHGIEVQGYESLYLQWLNEVPVPLLSPAIDPEGTQPPLS